MCPPPVTCTVVPTSSRSSSAARCAPASLRLVTTTESPHLQGGVGRCRLVGRGGRQARPATAASRWHSRLLLHAPATAATLRQGPSAHAPRCMQAAGSCLQPQAPVPNKQAHLRNSRASALPMPQLPPVMTTRKGRAGWRHTWRTAAWCAAAARPPSAPPARTGSQAGVKPETPAGGWRLGQPVGGIQSG